MRPSSAGAATPSHNTRKEKAKQLPKVDLPALISSTLLEVPVHPACTMDSSDLFAALKAVRTGPDGKNLLLHSVESQNPPSSESIAPKVHDEELHIFHCKCAGQMFVCLLCLLLFPADFDSWFVCSKMASGYRIRTTGGRRKCCLPGAWLCVPSLRQTVTPQRADN